MSKTCRVIPERGLNPNAFVLKTHIELTKSPSLISLHFRTHREQNLWIIVLILYLLILASLWFSGILLDIIPSQDIHAAMFLLGMLLVASSIVVYAIATRKGRIKVFIIIGILTIWYMALVRFTLAERSHLIEYSVLSIFILEAFQERYGHTRRILSSALSIGLASFLGLIDECVQWFIPHRVFDPIDMWFNSLASVSAIGSIQLFRWLVKRITKTSEIDQ